MALIYPAHLNNKDEFPGAIKFTAYTYMTALHSAPRETVVLFLPDDMKINNTLNWEAISATDTVLKAGAALTAPAEVKKTPDGKKPTEEIKPSKWNRIFKGAQAAASSSVGDLTQVATGVAINPYTQMMFKRVDLRSFDFTFLFHARDPAESQTIHSIIKAFRMYSLPMGDIGEYTSSPLLAYPGEFDIEYLWRGQQNPFLPKFKRSVIVSLDVDYNAASTLALHHDGAPVVIRLTMRFQERDIVVAGDVEKEGY